MDSVEQYSRKDNLVITGLKTKHMTWTRVASCNAQHVNELENASDDEMQNFEKQVVNFLNTKLGTCIGNKTTSKPDNVIVRFINIKCEIGLLKRAKALKEKTLK